MVTDALGKEIVVGGWHGYSRNDGGFSRTTIGQVSKVTEGDAQYVPGKARLVNCKVNTYLYGQPSDYRKDKKPADVTIAGSMIFPVEI